MTDGTNNDLDIVEQAEDAKVEIDAKEVERLMVEAAQARAEDPTETAAGVYQLYMPHFERALPKLSTRGLRRVINFLVKYPLHQEDFRSANEFEKEFMHLTNGLIEAKFVMVMDTFSKHSKEIYEASQRPLTSEEEQQVIADLKAGGASDEDIQQVIDQREKRKAE